MDNSILVEDTERRFCCVRLYANDAMRNLKCPTIGLSARQRSEQPTKEAPPTRSRRTHARGSAITFI